MPDNSTQLFLVRHGRTALNAAGQLRGLANPPLDEIGMHEARVTAEALRNRGIALIYCSPLDRAVTTATIIAERVGCDVQVTADFNDRDYGPWTGHLKSEVVAEFGSVNNAPGVESTGHVLERVLPALDRVADEHPNNVFCIVTHDAVIRPLLTAFDPHIGPIEAPTASWSELVRTNGAWSVLAVDQKAETESR